MPDLTLHPHETARLRVLLPGEELLVVRPVEPQPDNPEVFGDISPVWGRGIRRGDDRLSIHAATNVGGKRVDKWIRSPHRPGDVKVIEREGDASWSCCKNSTRMVPARRRRTYRLQLARVEAWRVREVKEDGWQAAGFVPNDIDGVFSARDVARLHWDQTYLDPEYAWDRAWAWCEWWQTAQGECDAD